MSDRRPLRIGNKGKALADDLAARELITAMVENGIGDVASKRLTNLKDNNSVLADRYTEEAELVDTITFDTSETSQDFNQHMDSLIEKIEDEQGKSAASS